MDFKDKKILVVGGSSGIGLETVRRLVGDGADVWVASRTESEELANLGTSHISVDAENENMADLKENLPDTLNGFVYCPGTITLKPFASLSTEDFRRDLEVNLLGAIRTLQAALPALRKSRGASVVFFSTVAAQAGMSYHASVAAAKSAVEGLGLSLAAELASAKIRVNVVAPSLTDTRLAGQILSTDQKREAASRRHPLGRFGKPGDIAAIVTFLLSDEADWMTGQIIGVDGGLSSLRPL